MKTKILRRPQVILQTGLSRSSIYLRMSKGTFPRPISLGGGRAVGWLETDIDEWFEKQINLSKIRYPANLAQTVLSKKLV